MKTLALALMIALGSSVAGCAAAPQEDVASSDDKLLGWLVSPPDFDEENLWGTWVPYEADRFVGTPTTFKFAKDGSYRLGASSSATAPKAGDWDLMKHPVPTFLVGTHVITHPTGAEDGSLFVFRHPSGEIRLVDTSTCFLFSCKNVWTRTPTLTVNEL